MARDAEARPVKEPRIAVGDAVFVGGRHGEVTWDGRPGHQFVMVRWSDDGSESNLIPLSQVAKESYELPPAKGGEECAALVDTLRNLLQPLGLKDGLELWSCGDPLAAAHVRRRSDGRSREEVCFLRVREAAAAPQTPQRGAGASRRPSPARGFCTAREEDGGLDRRGSDELKERGRLPPELLGPSGATEALGSVLQALGLEASADGAGAADLLGPRIARQSCRVANRWEVEVCYVCADMVVERLVEREKVVERVVEKVVERPVELVREVVVEKRVPVDREVRTREFIVQKSHSPPRPKTAQAGTQTEIECEECGCQADERAHQVSQQRAAVARLSRVPSAGAAHEASRRKAAGGSSSSRASTARLGGLGLPSEVSGLAASLASLQARAQAAELNGGGSSSRGCSSSRASTARAGGGACASSPSPPPQEHASGARATPTVARRGTDWHPPNKEGPRASGCRPQGMSVLEFRAPGCSPSAPGEVGASGEGAAATVEANSGNTSARREDSEGPPTSWNPRSGIPFASWQRGQSGGSRSGTPRLRRSESVPSCHKTNHFHPLFQRRSVLVA